MTKRIERLYAKIDGKDNTVEFTLLMHKDIEVQNLLANDRVPTSTWNFIVEAFRSINGSEGVNGYVYDTTMTGGLRAVSATQNGLDEMMAEMD